MIYIIRMGETEYYKIGYTDREVDKRLAELQTGNPLPLKVVAILPEGTELDEIRLHSQFITNRTNGGDEWFNLSDEQLEKIGEIFNEYDGKHTNPIRGHTTFDVRPLCGRQQYSVASNGENVSNTGSAFDSPKRKPLFNALRGEH